jgi:hypothetical protein
MKNFNMTLKRLEECKSTVLQLLRSLHGILRGVLKGK